MNSFLLYIVTTLAIVFLLRILKSYHRDLANLSTLGAVIFLSGIALSILLPIVDYINYVAEQYTIGHLSVLWKAIGIAFVTATCAELCRSAEEEAVASKVELVGKCELLVISLPLLQELTSLMLVVLEETG